MKNLDRNKEIKKETNKQTNVALAETEIKLLELN